MSVNEPSLAKTVSKYDGMVGNMGNMTETMVNTNQFSPRLVKCNSSLVIGAFDAGTFLANAR